VPDFPSPPDGTVGPSVVRTAAVGPSAPATAEDIQLRVFISGAGSSDPDAVGLDEDIRLLVNAFVRGARSGAGQVRAAAPASQGHGDVQIALHGLNLKPEEANELRQLISELVAKRAAGDGGAP